MPFDHLPNSGINFNAAIPHNIQSVPARPVFPMWQVVKEALDKLLPALDPIEHAKRQLALESIPIKRAQLAAEAARLPLIQKELEIGLKTKEQQYNHLIQQQKNFKQYYQNVDQLHKDAVPKPTVPVELPKQSEEAIPTEVNPPQLIPPDKYGENGLSMADIPEEGA